ncbi:MAG: pyrroloquinoline quinone-dependent dehydrogenase, partial [bacterium]
MNTIKYYFSVALLICIALLGCISSGLHKSYTDWRVTGGSRENLHYSSIKQIDTNNISQLEVAWIYHTENKDQTRFGAMECNPIIIDSVMFGVSPKLKLFAINARTGK